MRRFRHVVRHLLRDRSSLPPQVRPRTPRPPRFRPAVEALDERCLLSAGLGSALLPHPAPAAVLNGPAAGQSLTQPFHLSGAGSFTFTSPPGAAFDVTFTASGTASSLGHWTNYGELHFDGPNTTGTAVFAAANGDVLVAHAEGTFLNQDTGEAAGTFTFVSSATLSDGTVVTSTGRFANVSGSARLAALGFPNFTFTLSGEISYSPSDRAHWPGH
jgi:hypothetical protein